VVCLCPLLCESLIVTLCLHLQNTRVKDTIINLGTGSAPHIPRQAHGGPESQSAIPGALST
jgi:hypothetical protein